MTPDFFINFAFYPGGVIAGVLSRSASCRTR
jgi:hypothetical protein